MDIYRRSSGREEERSGIGGVQPVGSGRENDFMADGWRVFKIMAEFVNGFEMMSEAGPAVAVFGSTRVQADSPEYLLAEKLGSLLAAEGFSVITGGGPGVMAAANKGAQIAGGESIGFNIKLPNQQQPNRYIDHGKLVSFQYFFVRKVMFMKYAQAFIALPGGFGTLDEVMEAITLIQTGKSERFPVILVGKSYWEGLYSWIEESMCRKKGYIHADDLEFIYLEDSPEEVIAIIKRFYPEGYSLNF
jgi:uncharacterized protein (TIGR00730 family)